MKQAKSLPETPHIKINHPTDKIEIKCDEEVEFHVWDLDYQSKTISAASVKAVRKNQILKCVFRNLENKIILKMDAMGLTQKFPKPMGML